eukprot:TRINITY_DN3179_c0_g2_i9.p2 TRINITY_DN3179_c0_g2~~TRINITY_DN3179_c0_g2_i9.p2  ORF type:complete len:113 (+),score=3.99 TRINITY_DN3179_c0_g2_i9:854-1192(+)
MMNSLADMSAEVARQLRDRTGDTCIEVSPEEEDYSQLSFCMPLSVHTYGESGEKQANLAEQLQNAQRFMPINVPESHSAYTQEDHSEWLGMKMSEISDGSVHSVLMRSGNIN